MGLVMHIPDPASPDGTDRSVLPFSKIVLCSGVGVCVVRNDVGYTKRGSFFMKRKFYKRGKRDLETTSKKCSMNHSSILNVLN
jgi:hypothetical protein